MVALFQNIHFQKKSTISFKMFTTVCNSGCTVVLSYYKCAFVCQYKECQSGGVAGSMRFESVGRRFEFPSRFPSPFLLSFLTTVQHDGPAQSGCAPVRGDDILTQSASNRSSRGILFGASGAGYSTNSKPAHTPSSTWALLILPFFFFLSHFSFYFTGEHFSL